MFKNVAGQRHTFFAFVEATNDPKSGDVANITVFVKKDNGAVVAISAPNLVEEDPIDAKGYYTATLSQAETNGDKLLFTAVSSTLGVLVIGAPPVVYTLPATLSGVNGAWTATVTVLSGGLPVVGATVRLTQGAVSEAYLTNSSGVVTPTRNDGTYVVTVVAGGFTQTAPGSITIAGGNASTTINLVANTANPTVNQKSYSTVTEGNAYFSDVLYADDWTNASTDDKQKALNQAHEIVEQYVYIGERATYTQTDEWPRKYVVVQGTEGNVVVDSTTVPVDIKTAEQLIARTLLGGYDPELEARNRGITSRRYASIGTTYDTENVPDHTKAECPSAQAWALLRRYINPNLSGTIILRRVS